MPWALFEFEFLIWKKKLSWLEKKKLVIFPLFKKTLLEKPFSRSTFDLRERGQLGLVTLNGNLALSRWVSLAYDH